MKVIHLAKRLECLAVNAKVATVLGSIPAYSDSVESEGEQMKQCWITYTKRIKSKKSPLKKLLCVQVYEKRYTKSLCHLAFLETGARNFTYKLFGPFSDILQLKSLAKIRCNTSYLFSAFLGYAAAISASWQHPAWSRRPWGRPRGGSPAPGRPGSAARTRTACASPRAGGRSARPRRCLCPPAAPPGRVIIKGRGHEIEFKYILTKNGFNAFAV